jgi:hypothetical protein
MPPDQAAPQQQQGGSFVDLISNIFSQLGTLQDVLGRAKVPPQVAQKFAAIQSQFQSAVESLQGGGDEGQEMAPKQQGPASPEAGAADVIPMQ